MPSLCLCPNHMDIEVESSQSKLQRTFRLNSLDLGIRKKIPKIVLRSKNSLQNKEFSLLFTLLIRRVRLIGMALPWKGSDGNVLRVRVPYSPPDGSVAKW